MDDPPNPIYRHQLDYNHFKVIRYFFQHSNIFYRVEFREQEKRNY